jgi:hypothetical protein
VFQGNSTSSPVPDDLPDPLASGYAEKYRGTTIEERSAALDSLKNALEYEASTGAKGSAEVIAEMKRELQWLQDSLEG